MTAYFFRSAGLTETYEHEGLGCLTKETKNGTITSDNIEGAL